MAKFRWEKNEKLFSPPIFPSKTLENTLFYCIFAPFRAVWFHMKHTPLFALFHVKHMFLTPFYRLFIPCFKLFYPIATPITNFCVFSVHFLVDFVLFFRFLAPIYSHFLLLRFGQTAFKHHFDSFRAVLDGILRIRALFGNFQQYLNHISHHSLTLIFTIQKAFAILLHPRPIISQ